MMITQSIDRQTSRDKQSHPPERIVSVIGNLAAQGLASTRAVYTKTRTRVEHICLRCYFPIALAISNDARLE